MFMIETPQTIQLFGLKSNDPDKETPSGGSITFQHETDDVSKCQMVVRIEDRIYTFTFGTRGPMVETAYEDDATRKAAEERQKQIDADLKAQRAHEQEAAREQSSHELATADDTTAKDVAWDAPHNPDPFARSPAEPTPAPEPNPFDPQHGNVNTSTGIARNPMMPEPQHG